jgi:hypothetical protein
MILMEGRWDTIAPGESGSQSNLPGHWCTGSWREDNVRGASEQLTRINMSSIERYLQVSLMLAISESKIDSRPHNYQDMPATRFDDRGVGKDVFSFRWGRLVAGIYGRA